MLSSLNNRISRRTSTKGNQDSATPATKLSNEHLDIWEHAALLYHGYEWQDAIEAFTYLSSNIADQQLRLFCLLNVAIIQSRLGDFDDAARSMLSAARDDDSITLIPYLMGLVQLELGDRANAKLWLEACQEALRGGAMSYSFGGLAFVLQGDAVSRQLAALKQAMEPGTPGEHSHPVLAGIPADCIFEAPPRSEKHSRPKIASFLRSSNTATIRPDRRAIVSARSTTPTSVASTAPKHTSLGLLEPKSTAQVDFTEAYPQQEEQLQFYTDCRVLATESWTSGPISGSHRENQWRNRPSTPYVPRDARGEYGSLRDLSRFIRAGPQFVDLSPRDARVEAGNTRELAQFIKRAGREQSAITLQQQTEEDITNGSVNIERLSAPEGVQTGELAELARVGERDHVPQRPLSDPGSPRDGHLSGPAGGSSNKDTESPDTPITVISASDPDETAELLLPRAYNPKALKNPQSGWAQESVELLMEEEMPSRDKLGHLHTAASSTSDLFRSSVATMMTNERAGRAREEALRTLEGHPRLPRATRAAHTQRTQQKPLPPPPSAGRLESIASSVDQPMRVSSSKIFEFIGKG